MCKDVTILQIYAGELKYTAKSSLDETFGPCVKMTGRSCGKGSDKSDNI